MKQISRLAFSVLAALVLFTGCGKGDDEAPRSSASLVAETVNCFATANKISTEGSSRLTYNARITNQGNAEWCSFALNTQVSEDDGTVGEPIYLYLKQNLTNEDRTAVIEVTFSDGYATTLSFTQTKYSESADYDKAWAEQPALRRDANYIYKTYYTTLSNGKFVRNYSICYDSSKRIAHWVAYPLHKSYTLPNVGRTDDWAYDPNKQLPVIPESAQQYVEDTYGTGYARGHQIPSADRYSTIATNQMTFYATNMMPQNGTFNGGIWSQLEGQIRTNMGRMTRDTLYVVTGTSFEGNKTTTDSKGNRIGLPSNCWKVLLRTRTGSTGKPIEQCTADELMGIGFWFSNSTSNPSKLGEAVLSIAEIESRTGFTFFRNLTPEAAAAVKSQKNYSEWKMTIP